MFPSFDSLAHREQKKAELLERVQRRLRQTNLKRDMYAEAMWASDEARYARVNPNSKVDASTQAGEPDIRKPAITKDSASGE
jgi:hypothetical protein